MATLSVQQITREGLAPTMSAAAGGGDEFINTGLQWIEVVNAHSGSWDVTVATQCLIDGNLAVGDRVETVVNGTRKLIGPFKPSIYNDVNAKVQITYSGVTALTICVLELGAQ